MLLCVAVICLSVVGASYLIMRLALYVLADKRKTAFTTLFLKGENADLTLSFYLEGVKILPFFETKKIFAVNCGVSPCCEKECQSIAKRFDYVSFISFEEYIKKINYLKENG